MFLHIRYNDVLKYRFDFNECFFFWKKGGGEKRTILRNFLP